MIRAIRVAERYCLRGSGYLVEGTVAYRVYHRRAGKEADKPSSPHAIPSRAAHDQLTGVEVRDESVSRKLH
jgi:hypothetical protein